MFHTYSAYARGFDGLWPMWQWLDRAPLGRNEGDLSWFHRHDEYGEAPAVIRPAGVRFGWVRAGHRLVQEEKRMLARSGYPAGVPCWVDIVQPDLDATMAFYGGLFGWSFEVRTPEARRAALRLRATRRTPRRRGRRRAGGQRRSDGLDHLHLGRLGRRDGRAGRGAGRSGDRVAGRHPLRRAGRRLRRSVGGGVRVVAGARQPRCRAGQRARLVELQ